MKNSIIFIFLSWFIMVTTLHAEHKTQTFEAINKISVYDGDTFRTDLNCSTDFFCKHMSIRVYGVDTPEIRSGTGTIREHNLARKAQKLTKEFLKKSMTNGKVILNNCSKGKYFRLVCSVSNDKGVLLDRVLIENGLGVKYFGGTKIKDWSK